MAHLGYIRQQTFYSWLEKKSTLTKTGRGHFGTTRQVSGCYGQLSQTGKYLRYIVKWGLQGRSISITSIEVT